MNVDSTPRLTREQAAIIGLATGTLCGLFEDYQNLAEELAGRPILTHEFGFADIQEEIKSLAKPLLRQIAPEGAVTDE